MWRTLSVSIASLALDARAVSNAAKGHSLLEAYDQVDQTESGKNLTQAQEFLKADQEAQDDFVRRCEVVVTVSDDKFLPVKPLDRFCQTTDAAMECRMKVGMRLKETHARDGDMGKFCSAVYDWFQGKYGMKCPQQCRKLQCRSTCMWLDAKKKVNKDNDEIKDEMQQAENLLNEIKGVNKQVDEKVRQENKIKFNINIIGVKIERADKDLKEAKSDATAAEAKRNKVHQAAVKLEKTIAATEDNLVKREDAMMKQQFAIDKAKLKLKALGRAAERNTDRAKEDRQEEKSLKDEAAKIQKDIDDLNKQKAAVTKIRDSDKKAAESQAAVVKAKAAKMTKAIKELDQYKVKGMLLTQADPAPRSYQEEYERGYFASQYKKHPNVANLKELVENQYKRTKAADRILQDLEKKIRDGNQEIKEQEADVGRLQKQLKEANDKANAAKTKAEALEKKATADLEAAAKVKQDDVEKPQAVLDKAKETQAKEQKSKAKAQKTLKFMQNILAEEGKKVVAAKGAVSIAEMALKTQKDNLEKTKVSLTERTKEKTDLETKVKGMKKTLAEKEKAMEARITAYKVEVKDLEKHKPEIVRLHKLQPGN